MKNPFTVLGITPQVAARLDNEALYHLVRVCYRVLQQAHHPDKLHKQTESARQRSTKLATEINLAYEKLNWAKDPESFLLYKERYLKTLRRKDKNLRNLEAELETIIEKQREMANSFWQYVDVEDNKDQAEEANAYSCLKIPAGLTLGVIDVVMRQNVRSQSWASGLGYKEIKLDENGQMYYRLSRQRKFSAINFIKLIGTIAKDKIDLDALLEKKPLKGTLYIPNQSLKRKSTSRKYIEVLNTIPVYDFKWYCLPFLKPNLAEGHYLFSVHRKTSGLDKVFLEGVISRISRA